ncbi:cytochrome c biogenesis protein CcsA [bacterium]|nr:cytochrome c biogenesis protein CcsA [bacterium]
MAFYGILSIYMAFFSTIGTVIVLFYKFKMEQYKSNFNYNKIDLSKILNFSSIAFILISTLLLEYAFISNDFSIKYVANYSDSTMPILYRMAALWGGQEGSLLFWLALISIYNLVLLFRENSNTKQNSIVFISVNIIQLFFISVVALKSNPFEIFTDFIPKEGAGMNPQLQTVSMLLHPPLLYMGYTGFGITLAYSFGVLISGGSVSDWAEKSRRWSVLSWIFLTAGNVLGSVWAYTELGWGGFWAWDPVENSSFMPWITSTALIHSLYANKKGGYFPKWSYFWALLTYILTIFGTYITRSGVIESVHAFSKSSIGDYFLFFIIFIVVIYLYHFIKNYKIIKYEQKIEYLTSKEGMFLLSNILFLVAFFIVLFGTVAPTIFKFSLANSFFTKVFVPVAIIILILMGFSPLARWKTPLKIERVLIISTIASFLASSIIFFIIPIKSIYTPIVIFFVIETVILTLSDFKKGFFKNKKKYGAYLVHIGIALFFIGALGSSYQKERQYKVKEGEKFSFNEYKFSFDKISRTVNANHYEELVVEISLFNSNQKIAQLTPSKRYFFNLIGGISAEASLDINMLRDVYVVVEGVDQENSVALIRVYINPFMVWLWIGAGLVISISLIFLMGRSKKPENFDKQIDSQNSLFLEKNNKNSFEDIDAKIFANLKKYVDSLKNSENLNSSEKDNEIITSIPKEENLAMEKDLVKFCASCGKPVDKEGKFCKYCGYKIR